MSKHTPGPWKQKNWRIYVEQGESVRVICDTATNQRGRENPETRANARLIAASPDLLGALRALLSPRTYDAGMDCYVIQAKSEEAAKAVELLAKIGGEDES